MRRPWPLIHNAKSPVSFAQNTVLGWLLSMAGRFEVTPVIAVPELSLDLAKRDPTGLSGKGETAQPVCVDLLCSGDLENKLSRAMQHWTIKRCAQPLKWA